LAWISYIGIVLGVLIEFIIWTLLLKWIEFIFCALI